MTANSPRTATIVGAGLAGALLATLLARRGLYHRLYQLQFTSTRPVDALGSGDGSVNLVERPA